ncbi:MAG TPA: hypothetical protein VGS19_34970 [Streptosporangiaceae bacterium]|nr:hypothetical protein [Streptosporangiaceae bacterium]
MRMHDTMAARRSARPRSLRAGGWLVAAAAAAVAVTTAFAGTGSAATLHPTASQSGHYWVSVRLHGQVVKVHTAGRWGIFPQHSAAGQRLARQVSGRHPKAGNLTYHGGPVAHAPKVYVDFWGSQWKSDKRGTRKYMHNFFSGLGRSNDNWSTITSQYTDSSGQGPHFTGAVLHGTWLDGSAAAPSHASASALGAEAVTAAKHFGVSGDDIQVIVVSPHGTHPDGFPNTGFCAWHSVASSGGADVPFTNMPYVLDAGASCAANSVQGPLDGFSVVVGHEYAETLTDPEAGNGWLDSSGAEIGDKCVGVNLFALHLTTGSFAVQTLWSNKVSGCAAHS